jgi:predicted GNAT family acetyltransferase
VGWQFTGDPETYAAHAWELLARAPAERTVALTILESARAGYRWSDDPMLFGWYEDGEDVCGAVLWTPPFELLLAVVPDDSVAQLASALGKRRAALPGVNGDVATVGRFVDAWRPRRWSAGFEMRLYKLDALQPPSPPSPGAPRVAREEDLPIAVRWLQAFQADAGVRRTDVQPTARERIAGGRLWLWEIGGVPVSMAARTPTVAGVARIAPVYTPSEHRRRGYGTAITAVCTADALARDADHVVLFTDLANPTSNSIYQQIGFRPVADYRVVHFDANRASRRP